MKIKLHSKKLKLVCVILILIILFLIIQSTYSKYIQKEDKFAKFNMSGWHILINGVNISTENEFSDIVDLETNPNPNVKNDVIVPSSTGIFKLEIDSTGTQVDFDYTISIDTDTEDDISDFKLISYQVNDDETEIPITESKITGTINHADTPTAPVTNEIKVKVQWYDKDSSNEEAYETSDPAKDNWDNFSDVYKSKNFDLKIPINVKVEQHQS